MPLHRDSEAAGGRPVPADTVTQATDTGSGSLSRRTHRCNFSRLELILFILSARVSLVVTTGAQERTAVHHHHVISRKFHQETSFAFIETSKSRVVSENQELRNMMSNANQLRFAEEKAFLKNVTAQLGHNVFMHCMVEPLGDKVVSWLRLRDFHLLTVGLYTYTSDDRFVVRHGSLQPNDWALQIKHLSPVDEGIYECQVNSDPPRSQYYRLNVKVPETRMIGSPDMFVRAGSAVNLTCLISNSPELPAFVFWYHNDRMINYDYEDREKGSITLRKDSSSVDTVISHLSIRSTKLNDSGNYSCHFVGSSIEPAHIYVHVLQGERRTKDFQSDGSGVSLSAGVRVHVSNDLILITLILIFTAVLRFET